MTRPADSIATGAIGHYLSQHAKSKPEATVAITLSIENMDRLPDGGPLEFTAGERGFDIGREQHLDWCLPDPDRIVSGLHCQVRFEEGSYWLYDVSRNGTYLNGAQARVKSPYRLANGDRLAIGDYFIRVALSDGVATGATAFPPEDVPQARFVEPQANEEDIWATDHAAPAQVSRRWFEEPMRPPAERPSDGLDQFVDMPSPAWQDEARQARPLPPAPPAAPKANAAARPEQVGNSGLEPFLATLARAAGISPQALTGRPAEAVAEEIGQVLGTVAEQMAALLKARAAAKQMTKSGERTMIGAERNNPLKFVPTPSEALEIMLQKNRPGYLGAPEAVSEGFENIKSHERATYAAMQAALLRLMEDFAPEEIEQRAGTSAFTSHKGRAWDIYVERWRAIEKNENGLLDAFLQHFRQAYDEAVKGR